MGDQYRRSVEFTYATTHICVCPFGLVSFSNYRYMWNWSNYWWWRRDRQIIFSVIVVWGRTFSHIYIILVSLLLPTLSFYLLLWGVLSPKPPPFSSPIIGAKPIHHHPPHSHFLTVLWSQRHLIWIIRNGYERISTNIHPEKKPKSLWYNYIHNLFIT